MPIYEYQCEKCGIKKEVMHKISETPEILCPECSATMYKLISPSAFHLKGSGWYVTDYAGKKNGSSTVSSSKATDKKDSCNTCKSSCSAKAANE